MKRTVLTTLGMAVLGAGLVLASHVLSAQALASQAPPAAKSTQVVAPAAAKPAPKRSARTLAVAHAAGTLTTAEQTALVKQYCAACHNDRAKAGGLSLAAFDAAEAATHSDITEKMIRKLRAGM